MADTGWKFPGTVDGIYTGGNDWTTPDNVKLDDGVEASWIGSKFPSDAIGAGPALKVTNFSFSLPHNATITGVECRIQGRTDPNHVNEMAYLTELGTPINLGSEKRLDWTTLTTTDTTHIYGSPTDLWHAPLTVEVVNQADFGWIFMIYDDVSPLQMIVDYMQMKVYYEIGEVKAPDRTSNLIPSSLVETPHKKNAVINGTMGIWQRGTSDSPSSAGGLSRLADRYVYYHACGSGAATYQQSTDVPTYAQVGCKLLYSADVDITAVLATPLAGSFHEASLSYTLEGYDYARIAGGDATLSFWVKTNKTGSYAVALRNTAKNRCYTIKYTVDTADTWEKKVFTVPLTETGGTWDYTNGAGININWAYMSAVGYASTSTFETWLTSNVPYIDDQVNLFDNTANYFRIAAVQFEKGTVATPLEQRPYEQELGLCQRYYETGYVQYIGNNSAGGVFAGDCISFNVTKRAVPTITLGTPVENVNLGTQSLTGIQINAFRIFTTTSSSGQYYYTNTFIADSDF